MPSFYAHSRFGTEILNILPADTCRSIQRFRRLFDIGLHGPDLFYFHNPLQKSGTGILGIKYHEISGKTFFTRICRAIRIERSEAASAYLYGVLCHYVLDSLMHPLILGICQETGIRHALLEGEFDRLLLQRDQKLPPDPHKMTSHLKLTEGEYDTVSRFYPPATVNTIKSALHSFLFYTRLQYAPGGAKRRLFQGCLRVLGKELTDLMLPQQIDPAHQEHLDRIAERYESILAAFPGYLEQIHALMTYSAPLDEQFLQSFV